MSRSKMTDDGLITKGFKTEFLVLTVVIFLLALLGNNLLKKPVLLLMSIFYIIIAAMNYRSYIEKFFSSVSMPIFLIYFCASVSWSIIPAVTFNLVLVQSLFILTAVSIAIHHKTGFCDSLKLAVKLLIPIVVLYTVLFFGKSWSADGLNGIYHHKNTMGVMMGFSALVLLYSPGRTKVDNVFAGIALGLLVASSSATSMGMFAISAVSLVFFDALAKSKINSNRIYGMWIVRTFFYYSFVIVLVLLVFYREDLLNYIQDNLSHEALTGRGQLWLAVLDQSRGSSLFGIGLGTMWQADAASDITNTTLFREDPYWVQNMSQSDGAYVDIMAALGAVGLSLFLLTAVDYFKWLLRGWENSDSKLGYVLVVFILGQAVTESTLLYSTNILWLVYLLFYFRYAVLNYYKRNLNSNVI